MSKLAFRVFGKGRKAYGRFTRNWEAEEAVDDILAARDARKISGEEALRRARRLPENPAARRSTRPRRSQAPVRLTCPTTLLLLLWIVDRKRWVLRGIRRVYVSAAVIGAIFFFGLRSGLNMVGHLSASLYIAASCDCLEEIMTLIDYSRLQRQMCWACR